MNNIEGFTEVQYEDTNKIFDLIQILHTTFKLVDSDDNFVVTTKSYTRQVVNYHISTIQKPYSINNTGICYLKVGITENFGGTSTDGVDTLYGSVVIGWSKINELDINIVDKFDKYLLENDFKFLFISNERTIMFYSYEDFEKICEGILTYLM